MARGNHGTIHSVQKNHAIAAQIKMIGVNTMRESCINLRSAW
jgi:hypothetical protein